MAAVGAPGLQAVRRRLAAALGASGRMVWRRSDLQEVDTVVLDLITEALVRLQRVLYPRGGDPRGVLAQAPPQVKKEVELLKALASREEEKRGHVFNLNAKEFVPGHVFNINAKEFVPGQSCFWDPASFYGVDQGLPDELVPQVVVGSGAGSAPHEV